jgi:hypothetical protein
LHFTATIRQFDKRKPDKSPLNAVKFMGVAMSEGTPNAGPKVRPATKGLGHRTNAFAAEVYAAVRSGKLAQPFSIEAAKRACPGYAEGVYRNFFKRHCAGNPSGMAELFVRRAANRFEIIDAN